MLASAATALLLILGAVFAVFGVLGFYGNWTSHPDHDSLRYVQALATTGRRLTATGLALYAFHYSASGAALLGLLLAALLAAATYLTRTSNTIIPTGATPRPPRCPPGSPAPSTARSCAPRTATGP